MFRARSLASQMGDPKREEFVAWCLSQARRLQTDGDIPGAQAIAAQGLASYPNEPRLQQLQAALQRAQDAAVRTPMPPPAPKPAAPGPPPLAKPAAGNAPAAKPPGCSSSPPPIPPQIPGRLRSCDPPPPPDGMRVRPV